MSNGIEDGTGDAEALRRTIDCIPTPEPVPEVPPVAAASPPLGVSPPANTGPAVAAPTVIRLPAAPPRPVPLERTAFDKIRIWHHRCGIGKKFVQLFPGFYLLCVTLGYFLLPDGYLRQDGLHPALLWWDRFLGGVLFVICLWYDVKNLWATRYKNDALEFEEENADIVRSIDEWIQEYETNDAQCDRIWRKHVMNNYSASERSVDAPARDVELYESLQHRRRVLLRGIRFHVKLLHSDTQFGRGVAFLQTEQAKVRQRKVRGHSPLY